MDFHKYRPKTYHNCYIYSQHFFLGGADAQVTETGMIEQAFKQAVHWEKTIMAELVRVSMLADKICDTEVFRNLFFTNSINKY